MPSFDLPELRLAFRLPACTVPSIQVTCQHWTCHSYHLLVLPHVNCVYISYKKDLEICKPLEAVLGYCHSSDLTVWRLLKWGQEVCMNMCDTFSNCNDGPRFLPGNRSDRHRFWFGGWHLAWGFEIIPSSTSCSCLALTALPFSLRYATFRDL